MSWLLWVGFIAFVLAMLALDLGVFNRKPHEVRTREALVWTVVWIALAMLFNAGIYFIYEHHWLGMGLHAGATLGGKAAALEFLAGYVIEKSLSLDNVFVIALIFSYFATPAIYQHRVLFWGVLGALIMRGAMIGLGAALIDRFDWIVYVFGGLLLITAVKMLIARHDNLEPNKNLLVRIARRMYPVSESYDGKKFFTHVDGKPAITLLFLVLLVVESSDVLFAVDSIPAVFAVTRDPFIVFTSNVFAILGLRSLYFALAGVMRKFRYIKTSLVFVLAFVGIKMLLSGHFHIPVGISLLIILGILGVGVAASVVGARRDTAALEPPPF